MSNNKKLKVMQSRRNALMICIRFDGFYSEDKVYLRIFLL